MLASDGCFFPNGRTVLVRSLGAALTPVVGQGKDDCFLGAFECIESSGGEGLESALGSGGRDEDLAVPIGARREVFCGTHGSEKHAEKIRRLTIFVADSGVVIEFPRVERIVEFLGLGDRLFVRADIERQPSILDIVNDGLLFMRG